MRIQHTFILWKIYPYYASRPGAMINTLARTTPVSNIFSWFHPKVMVPKVFKPLKFYCIWIILGQGPNALAVGAAESQISFVFS